MKPVVTLKLPPVLDVCYHTSALLCGLDALAREGVLDFRTHCATETGGLGTDGTHLEVELGDGSPPRIIGIDLSDRSNTYYEPLLKVCHVYLKRSFYPADVQSLPESLAAKIEPYGLNHACTTRSSNHRIMRAIVLRRLFHNGMESLRLARLLQVLPRSAEFEQDPRTPLQPSIIFQTRVWEGHEVGGEEEANRINEQRVAIIRALRKTFGCRFHGGLIPTRIAVARYPAEISPIPSRRKLYTAASKRHLVGIYTSGLFGSTAFKLSEYLAASQCVVAQPFRNDATEPLHAGRHFLPFDNVDECLSACERVLQQPDLAHELRTSGSEYYRRYVAPRAHVAHLLRRCGVLPPIATTAA